MKQVQLSVMESISDDVGKGIVRLDNSFMKSIGVKDGDIIAVHGFRKTFVIVNMAYPGDSGMKIVRMDGITRR